MQDITRQSWFSYLSEDQQALASTAYFLLEQGQQAQVSDYSYVVFPMAKAYEGFLKKYFFELGLISQQTYESRRFRVGRAFNPDLNSNQQDELWIFDDVARMCGLALAREMWDAWLECRNQVFHYFPLHNKTLSLAQAEAKLQQLALVMEGAVRCQTRVLAQQPISNQVVANL